MKRHILTISLEEYFQDRTFRRLIQKDQWSRFDTRLEANVLRTLDLLDKFNLTATFFALGWTAEHRPDVLREVVRRGHEIANKGYYPKTFREMVPDELRENMARARVAIEDATGRPVLGTRIPQQWWSPDDAWALDVLAKEGYLYDSSVVPLLRSCKAEPWRRFVHRHQIEDKVLWEFPISTCSYLGLAFPISGGNYVRQFPPPLVRRLLDNWNRRYSVPFVMYFHAWELDPEQVRIEASSPLVKIRHYRNLDRMYSILQDYFSRYQFTGIAEYLREDPEAASAMDRKQAAAQTEVRVRQSVPQSREPVRQQSKIPVSIVVPCYNEELIVPYLSNTLQSVQARLAHYDLRFILVDDCSTDNTWKVLGEAFGHRTNYVLVRQPVNGGVAAAILAGIRCAGTEIVCSMDCDCTYDPHELSAMIPLLTPETDLVTASPYHPLGGVRNVPKWRLTLSKTASRLYGLTLRHKLFTYTSCFRVYRRSSVMHMQLRNGRFIGVAEILGRLDLQGSRIVEHPCVLQVRLIGRSKMKTAAAVAGHLGLIGWLLKQRVQRQSAAGTPQSSAVPKAAEPSL